MVERADNKNDPVALQCASYAFSLTEQKRLSRLRSRLSEEERKSSEGEIGGTEFVTFCLSNAIHGIGQILKSIEPVRVKGSQSDLETTTGSVYTFHSCYTSRSSRTASWTIRAVPRQPVRTINITLLHRNASVSVWERLQNTYTAL